MNMEINYSHFLEATRKHIDEEGNKKFCIPITATRADCVRIANFLRNEKYIVDLDHWFEGEQEFCNLYVYPSRKELL
jgi:hypothetical protein